MKIIVNDETREVSDAVTVQELLRDRGLERQPCAVEVNQQVVKKAEHETRQLQDGDRVEIVTLVGGG